MAQAVIATTPEEAEVIGRDLRRVARRTVKDFVLTYPYLLLAIFFFIGWQVLPIYYAAKLSFMSGDYLGINRPMSWAGTANYSRVFHDILFWKGVLRAFIFTAIFVPGMILIPMVLAILVDRVTNPKLATMYRLVLLVPSMIPSPLIFVLWTWMYNQRIGPINYFLVDIIHVFDKQGAPLWLNDAKIVFFAIAVMEWWWGLGYHTMFFLAGLATIPKDIFDAARLDGASEFRIFRGITMFRLLPIILVLAVIRFGTAMAVVDEYVITGALGDTANSTYTWTVYMLDEGFVGSPQFRGYAAAIGWVGAVFMLLVVGFFFWLFRSRD